MLVMNIKEKAEEAYLKAEERKLQNEYNRLKVRYEYFKTIFGEDIKLAPSYENPTHFEIEGYKFISFYNDYVNNDQNDMIITYKLRPKDIPFRELLQWDIINLATLGEYFHKIKELELEYAPKPKGKIAKFIFDMSDV